MSVLGRCLTGWAPGQGVSSERIGEVLRAVQESEGLPEAPPEPSWFVRALESLLESGVGDAVSHPAGWILLGSVLGLFLAHRWIKTRTRTTAASALDVGADARRSRVAELQSAARQARAAGDLVEALRLSLFAVVLELSAHGDLEFRSAWTNRELLHRGHPEPLVRERLEGLFDEFDPKLFGREPVTELDFERVEEVRGVLLQGAAT